MSHQVNVSDTLTFIPSSYDDVNSDYPGTYYDVHSFDRALTNATSTTRAAIYTNTGSRATTTVYLNFDCSEIPIGATINSISCQVKCGTQGTDYFGTRTVQMCTGTTTKGSATTMSGSNSSPRTHTLTVGSWTAAELQNAKLKFYIQRGTSNTTTGATFSIFGATLSVSYAYQGTIYDIVASSSVSGITVDPASQDAAPGDTATVRIDGNNLNDVEVTDNGVDITSQLVQHDMPSGGTVNRVLGSYTLVSGDFNGSGASYFQGLVGKGVDNTKTTSNYYSSGSGTIAVFTYDMSFTDIPSNATITRVWCEVNGHAESTSNSSEYMCAQLISGSTNLSSELNFKSIGTSNSTQTLEATTIPTIAQLEEMKLRCRLGYYGGAINGATAYVTYTVPAGNPYYWTYTITNVSADHAILVAEAGAYVPPEEDPTKTYYPITISSINATTNPINGTTRVEAGEDLTVTISPTDPQLTLALDNGVDITSQLIGSIPTNTYTVTTQTSGASYGFNYNSGTGYYVSTNNGQSNSAAVCRVNFDLESSVLVTIQYINYAEGTYDYGIFGQIDTALGTTYTADSNAYHSCSGSGDNSASPQTLTYELAAGTHFIDIKYRKDQYTDSHNDSLQWKITSIEATGTGGDYTYTLNNINQKHSLVFVFGNVNFYYITSSTSSGAKIFPDGQMVKLQGDRYRLIIVPDNVSATVTLTDNGANVTSSLTTETGVDKNNNPIINYIYELTNIAANHTLIVGINGATIQLYVKENGTWVTYSTAYKKINGSWVEVDITNVFNTSTNYRKG